MRGGNDLRCAVRAKFLDNLVDQAWINQRFIPLNVDDERELFRFSCDFGYSISSAAVTCDGQRDFGTPIESRLGDAHIVRGNDYRFETLRSFGSLPHSSQNWFAGNHMQWFSRKTRRTPARWNNADRLIHGAHRGRGKAKSKDLAKLTSGNAAELNAWSR